MMIRQAIVATCAAFAEMPANPHSTDHAAGWAAAEAVEIARAVVASSVGADAHEIVFTSGATEADNMALLGAVDLTGRRRRIVVGAIEHKAVLGPARELARRGFDLVVAPATRDGVVDVERLAGLIDESTLLVSVMLVNNEIGTVQPVRQVAALCSAAGALMHVDAAQALGWMEIDAYALGADMLSLSGHKMGGPNGIGALFVRSEIRHRLVPILHGGEQEDGLRPGTIPLPLCAGFAAACSGLPSIVEVATWRDRTTRLQDALLGIAPGSWVNGMAVPRHPGSISITMPGIDADALVSRLQPTIAVSRGSACTSGIAEPSHVLRAIGLTARECDATLRISTGRSTTDAEIGQAIEAFAAGVSELTSLHA